MKITAATSEAMMAVMTAKKITQDALGKAVDRDRSYIGQIIRGTLTSIPDELAVAIGKELGIDLFPQAVDVSEVSSTALQLSVMAENNPKLAALLETILSLAGGSPSAAYLPSVATEDLPTIGENITRIVMAWEQSEDPHYSKIAVETLTYLREFYRQKQADG